MVDVRGDSLYVDKEKENTLALSLCSQRRESGSVLSFRVVQTTKRKKNCERVNNSFASIFNKLSYYDYCSDVLRHDFVQNYKEEVERIWEV